EHIAVTQTKADAEAEVLSSLPSGMETPRHIPTGRRPMTVRRVIMIRRQVMTTQQVTRRNPARMEARTPMAIADQTHRRRRRVSQPG
ncbi:MAG: hypothetical protein EOM58_06760, partial [Clostridia bacterium]|nr:hypothetical protein [Clostridia bacterium]